MKKNLRDLKVLNLFESNSKFLEIKTKLCIRSV